MKDQHEQEFWQKFTQVCKTELLDQRLDPYATAITLIDRVSGADMKTRRTAMKIVFHALFHRRAPDLMADVMQHVNNLHHVLEECGWDESKAILAAVDELDRKNRELR